MHEVLYSLLGTIIGGIIALISSWIMISRTNKLELKKQKVNFLNAKRVQLEKTFNQIPFFDSFKDFDASEIQSVYTLFYLTSHFFPDEKSKKIITSYNTIVKLTDNSYDDDPVPYLNETIYALYIKIQTSFHEEINNVTSELNNILN